MEAISSRGASQPNAHSDGIAGGGPTHWVVSVLFLTLPSVLFVILHAIYTPGALPESLDLIAAWSLTLAGMIGPFLTLTAFVVSVIGTFQEKVTRAAKLAMWSCLSLSLVACLYLARTPP